MESALSEIQIDIEKIKEQIGVQETTDINERLADDIITATKFDKTELDSIRQNTKQVYLLDISSCETITEQWINGLSSLILCTNLEEFNCEETNKHRFEEELPDLIPDATLTIKIRSGSELKTMFIGYMDSNQAYMLLTNYVRTAIGAKVYIEKDGKLKEVTIKDISGLRVHV